MQLLPNEQRNWLEKIFIIFFISTFVTSPSLRAQTLIDVADGANSSQATGINDLGQVVGSFYATSSSSPEAFLYSENTFNGLGTLGGNSSEATGINDSGQIVGYSDTGISINTEAFVYSNGKMTGLGTLGGNFSYAKAINNSGQIVGYAAMDDGDFYAFSDSGGKMTSLGHRQV